MKKIKLFMIAFILCMISLIPTKVAHAEEIPGWLTITVNKDTEVTLNWKKKNVSRYEIYRQNVISLEKDTYGKKQKIATLSSTKTSFIDKKVKKGSHYRYTLCAYKKVNGKYKLLYTDESITCASKFCVGWDDYADCDADVSIKKIPLSFLCFTNMKPSIKGKISGYQIYRRKVGETTYKKIATIKTSKMEYTYIDNTVKKGVSYEYKIRAYYLNGKKTVYTSFSDKIMLSAVNKVGKYDVSVETPKAEKISSLTFKLTSKDGNGKMIFSQEDEFDYSYGKSRETAEYSTMKIVRYSKNGKNWTTCTSKTRIVLKENESMYLQLAASDGSSVPYPDKNTLSYLTFAVWGCREGTTYNNLAGVFEVDLYNMTATAEVNGEDYH